MAVTVETTSDAIAVRFRGIDRFWAMSRGLRIPLERIDGAAVSSRADAKRRCPKLRLPGSYWPGRLHAGSYGRGARRQLWCVHRAQQVLAVDLHGRPYARVVVEVDDPGAVAARIEAARHAA